jgi:DNA-binding MarR family transcriptional regulator
MKTLSRTQSVYTSLPQWAASVPGLPLAEVTLLRLIRVASLGITAITEPILRPDGLTESSYHTLVTIAASGPAGLTPGSLCDLIGQTRSNMTRILQLLATHKLIESLDDPHDARSKIVFASQAGRDLVETQGRELARLVALAEIDLTKEEKKVLENLLRKVLAGMDHAESEAVRTAATIRTRRPAKHNGTRSVSAKPRPRPERNRKQR